MREHITMSDGCGSWSSPNVPCGQGMQDVRLPSQQGSPCTDKHSMPLESQCTMKAALSLWCGVALWCVVDGHGRRSIV